MGIETGLPIAKSPRAARSPEAAVCPHLEEEVCLTNDLRVAFKRPHSGECHPRAFQALHAVVLNRDFSGASTEIFQRSRIVAQHGGLTRLTPKRLDTTRPKRPTASRGCQRVQGARHLCTDIPAANDSGAMHQNRSCRSNPLMTTDQARQQVPEGTR